MALIKKEMYFMARKIFIWKSSLKVHIEATMADTFLSTFKLLSIVPAHFFQCTITMMSLKKSLFH